MGTFKEKKTKKGILDLLKKNPKEDQNAGGALAWMSTSYEEREAPAQVDETSESLESKANGQKFKQRELRDPGKFVFGRRAQQGSMEGNDALLHENYVINENEPEKKRPAIGGFRNYLRNENYGQFVKEFSKKDPEFQQMFFQRYFKEVYQKNGQFSGIVKVIGALEKAIEKSVEGRDILIKAKQQARLVTYVHDFNTGDFSLFTKGFYDKGESAFKSESTELKDEFLRMVVEDAYNSKVPHKELFAKLKNIGDSAFIEKAAEMYFDLLPPHSKNGFASEILKSEFNSEPVKETWLSKVTRGTGGDKGPTKI